MTSIIRLNSKFEQHDRFELVNMGRSDSQIVSSSDSIRWKRGPLLGRGAFGSVWLALTLSGELVAVKVILTHHSPTPHFYFSPTQEAGIRAVDMSKAQKEFEKIRGEVSLLKSLRHPNIVS